MTANFKLCAGAICVLFSIADALTPQCGDVCFAIDGSGSIQTQDNFRMETDQVVEIVEDLKSMSTNVQNSGLVFGTGPSTSLIRIVSGLTDDADAFIANVNAEMYVFPGSTPMAKAIESCNQLLQNGNPTRPKTIVLLTDGNPSNGKIGRENTRDAAKAVKDAGVRLITVGFTNRPNLAFLRSIASKDSAGQPLGFNSIQIDLSTEIIHQISLEVCGGSCQIACEECDLQFAGQDCTPVYTVPTTQDRSFTPKLVMKDGTPVIGIANSNNLSPEFIAADGDSTEVQNFNIQGQHYSQSQFKPFAIRPASKKSGIGHETFQSAAQRQQVKDKCVRVFFSSYQILKPTNGKVIGNVNNFNSKGTNCAVFRTAP